MDTPKKILRHQEKINEHQHTTMRLRQHQKDRKSIKHKSH